VQREASLHDLLRHTAGLSYARDETPVAQATAPRAWLAPARQRAAGPGPGACPCCAIPARPGSSRATDVLGAVLEVIEGQSLEALLQRLILRPLGMDDTGLPCPRPSGSAWPSLLPKTRSRVRQ
jgi:CubicO group peptidase (beta-lactamase class C family)